MGGKKRTINEYECLIWTYSKRRDEYREKFGVTSEEYKKRVYQINIKLGNWRRDAKRQRDKRAKIDWIISQIKEFIGYNLYENFKSPRTKEGRVAKGIFFKYGMEHRIMGVDLSDRLGLKGKWTASKYRSRFTDSFKTNKYNREMYHRFLKFIKEQQCLKKES